MTPTFPIISIYLERGLEILNTQDPLDQITLNGLVKFDSNDCLYYDQLGIEWKSEIVSSNQKITFLSKLLAKSLYNPLVAIKRSWIQNGNCTLQDLVKKINYCIDNDDDVLTQFVDADNLKSKVDMCEDFDSLVKTLTDLIFKPNLQLIDESFG